MCRNHRKASLFIALVLPLLVSSPGLAAETLTICARSDGPPKHFVDASGEASGYAVDIAVAVVKKAGFVAEVRSLPWKRALDEALKGNCIITGFSKNLQREADYVFTNALYVDRVLLWQRVDDAFPFVSIEQLIGKRIGVARGSRYSGEFESNRDRLTIVEVDNTARLLRMLLGGRIDAAVISGGRASVRYITERTDSDRAALVPSEREIVIDPNYLGIPFSLKLLSSGEVLTRLNTAIESLRSSGAIQQLHRSYQ